MEIKAKIIISRFKEDYSWVEEYTDNYVVYNKGEVIENNNHILNVENLGGNQRDIFDFIISNYDNLPNLMAFVQAFPFDHCKKETFDKLILNNEFTSLEDYSHVKAEGCHKKAEDGGYMEINNSWYIPECNKTYSQGCKYSSFDEFMNTIFANYNHVDWIRFCPGSQYLIEKRQALFYSISFWQNLKDHLVAKNPTEGHIIERALWMILKGELQAVEELK